MTKLELKSTLDQAGVCSEAYSLDGGLPSERYVLSQEPSGQWEVYYSERGNRSGMRAFNSESAACQFFLNLLLEDPSVRRK
jgi:hypothetical protein